MRSPRHGPGQQRAIWPPEPGFFAFTLTRGAWSVPARIVQDADRWHAEIDGKVHPAHTDPAHAPMLSALWHGGVKIPESEYRWLEAVREHARAHDPEHPSLHPQKRIDPRRLKPIQPEQRGHHP